MGVPDNPVSTLPPEVTSAPNVSSGGSDILMIILICVFAVLAILFAIIAISVNQKNKRLSQFNAQPMGPVYGAAPRYQPAVNICIKCGAAHAPGAAFCPNCGSKL